MSDFNNVNIIGRVVANPNQNFTASGLETSEFSIANNYYVKTKNQNEVNFFNIKAFGKLAKTAYKYLTKGKQVCISGVLRQERW